MKRLSILTLFAALVMSLFATMAAAETPDFQKFGFPKIVAEKTIEAGKADSIAYGNVKITIPEGAFTGKVKFEVLEGPLANFQAKAPAKETVLMNFAFRVTDSGTNELIAKFNKPVMFFYTDAKINANSKYYDTATDGSFVLNKVPGKIEGNTLSHPVAGAAVGWAVTSPAIAVANATSPVTGISVMPWVTTGTGLVIASCVIFLVSRRRYN